MKVVRFNSLCKKTKKKKAKIFCVSNFFRNTMIIFSVLIFLFVFGLVNTSFASTFKECIDNFIRAINII